METSLIERKIIFESRIGSHLYGTSSPTSDEDFSGAFLPGVGDLFGLARGPDEWNLGAKVSTGARHGAGDVDRRIYVLPRLLGLMLEGQPSVIEFLYVPPEMVVASSPEWADVLQARDRIVSRRSIVPFTRFAQAQTRKASLKGDNLRMLRRAIEELAPMSSSALNGPLTDVLHLVMNPGEASINDLTLATDDDGRKDAYPRVGSLRGSAGFELPVVRSNSGALLLALGGRFFDVASKAKWVLNSFRHLEDKYGARSREAAATGQDWKSLSHAVRLAGEATELLATGTLTLPLAEPLRSEVIAVRRGERPEAEIYARLGEQLANLDSLASTSPLRLEPDAPFVESLCRALMTRHFCGCGDSFPLEA